MDTKNTIHERIRCHWRGRLHCFNDEQHPRKDVRLERACCLPGISNYVRALYAHPILLGGHAIENKDDGTEMVVSGASGWSCLVLSIPLSALC